MLSERNTKGREALASNFIVVVALAAFSFFVGRTFSNQILWVLLFLNFLIGAVWQCLSAAIVSGNATAKLENWQDRLTDRFAFQEIFGRLSDPEPPDYDAIWNRALERANRDITVYEWSQVVSQHLKLVGGYFKLFLTTIFIALFLAVICIFPAMIAMYWN